MSVLFIDPGKFNGWAKFSDQGKILDYGIVTGLDSFRIFLLKQSRDECPKKVIHEAYRIRPKPKREYEKYAAFGFSKDEREGHEITLMAVGTIQMWAETFDVEIGVQEVACLDPGYAYSGMPRATNHKLSHDRDAIAHGWYYFVRKGIIKPRKLEAPKS